MKPKLGLKIQLTYTTFNLEAKNRAEAPSTLLKKPITKMIFFSKSFQSNTDQGGLVTNWGRFEATLEAA